MRGDERHPLRARRRAPARHASAGAASPSSRADALREVKAELEAWREHAIPDPSAPLEAEDVARLVRECLQAVALGEAAAGFTVNTVHYYRRKEILDAPVGRTSAARYGLRHLWQAAGARLAGQLGLVTLAEARNSMRDESEPALATFVAERVVDARARQAVRRAATAPVVARPLVSAAKREKPESDVSSAVAARPLPSGTVPPESAVPAVVLHLPGDAWCVVPATHEARHSAVAARALVRALADALGAGSTIRSES